DGTVDAFFSRAPKHEWDVCGAALVLEEAGGTARQLDGSDLRFNQPVPRFRGIVARGGTPLELAPASGD
ncbi:MAG TPA: inositol monophosphatase family protein, partial [Longimicrobiaceae bacterium]|nr:inositol monophosphatase family protein [Longimicrobiaceae bacterium]